MSPPDADDAPDVSGISWRTGMMVRLSSVFLPGSGTVHATFGSVRAEPGTSGEPVAPVKTAALAVGSRSVRLVGILAAPGAGQLGR